jgi:hypothetical protein
MKVDPIDHSVKLWRRQAQIDRFLNLVRRFVRDDDGDLSDQELVGEVFARWKKHQAQPILDPSE